MGHGFYIDIGAQDPVINSVSLAFYEHGWRGVHVEPVPDYATKLRAARPDEEVVQAAIGKKKGNIEFFVIANTGMSTGDETIARQHRENGFDINKVQVPCLPLSMLLDAHKDKDIHWLKIDVEGMERDVIDSWLPSAVRPWIVVVESTLPNSPVSTHATWEKPLLKLGYVFLYFDGLNRYYISREHPELKKDFGLKLRIFRQFGFERRVPAVQSIRKLGCGRRSFEGSARLLKPNWQTGKQRSPHGALKSPGLTNASQRWMLGERPPSRGR